jgi:Dyp-type peroxidase family
MTRPTHEAEDVQGLVQSGYTPLTEACFLLLRVLDAAAARAWLGAARVTTVADLASQVPTALHVAISADGLRALGLPASVLAGFSAEFLSGMAGDAQRSRRLGDVGANAPANWDWGARDVPDVLLCLYAERGGLVALRESVMTADFCAGFETIVDLPTSNMGGHEPFGFTDGVSQPSFDLSGARRPDARGDAALAYGNALAAGELLLGYTNEYGRITGRPLVESSLPGSESLLPATGDGGRRDLGRNGTYLVFRQLAQDVRGFWRFAAAHATAAGGDATTLAEAMVGRHLSGAPLLPLEPNRLRGVGPDPDDVRLNNFTYASDPKGLRCPLGAHVRRANPRNGDMPGGRQGLLSQAICMLGFSGGDDLRYDTIASSRFHRILRRGREYGQTLTPEQAVADASPDAPDIATGLHFICLNANISRQFEFVQNAWLASAKFDGLIGEADPLLGNREPFPAGQATDGFGRLSGVPRFITVRGGAYFFLPGVRALRFIAGGGGVMASSPSVTGETGRDVSANPTSANWHELIPDGEAELFNTYASVLNRYQQSFARRGDGQAHRAFHVKSHVGLSAEFRVLEAIPVAAKHGVFKAPRTFQAWIRLSNGFSATRPDWFPDLLGCAVKLEGVDGVKLLPGEEHAGTQDFIALNQPYLPAEDAGQLLIMSTSAANVLTAPVVLVRGLGLAQALRVMLWTLRWTPRRLLLRSVATEDFYSDVPITIGPHAVKFKLQSRQPTTVATTRNASWRNYLRDDLRQRLAEADLRYDFMVQFYVDPVKTPIDGAAEWKPVDAPFVKLAELTIHRRDIDSTETKREESYLAGVAFNPWHAIAEHRPIGNIQRARGAIYQACARYRGRQTDPAP